MTLLLVLLGGAAGAVSRYLVGRWVTARTRDGAAGWPAGTFVVNMAGSLLLGLLVGSATQPGWAMTLVGVGFCGALTTYSSFGFETRRLPGLAAAANVLLNLGGGLVAVALGWLSGAMLFRS